MKKSLIVGSMLLVALAVVVTAQDRGRLLEARQLYLKATEIVIDHNPEDAIPMLKEALKVFQEEGSLADVRNAENVLSDAYGFLYDYENAYEYASVAASHSRTLCDTAKLVDILMRQRDCCQRLRRSGEAKSLTSEIMGLCLEYSDRNANVGILTNLSNIAREEGDFLLSETLADLASKAASGIDDEYDVLNSKMWAAYYKGEYALAAEYGQKQLMLDHSDVSDVILTMSSVALHFAKAGDKERALSLAGMVRGMIGSIDNYGIRKFAASKSLCMVYANLGLYEESLEMYRMAEAAGGGKFLRASPDIVSYNAGMRYRAGKMDECIAGYEYYSALCLDRFGRMSEQYANSLNYLANVYALSGDIPKGSRYNIDSKDIVLELARRDWKYLPSYERGELLKRMAKLSNDMASFAGAAGHVRDEFTAKSYDVHLLSKGLGLATEMSLRDAVKGDKTAKALLDSIDVMRSNLDRAKLSGNPSDVGSLYAGLVKAEAEMALKAPNLKGYGDFLDFTFNSLKSSLGPNDVAIDFTDFVVESGKHYYMAYVTRREFDAPELVNVFIESQLDELGIPADKPWMLYSGDNAKAAYDIVWGPLEKYMKPGDRVFFSPSGILHLLSPSSLPSPGGSLLSEVYDFRRVTSVRQIDKAVKDNDNVAVFASLPEELPYSLKEAETVASVYEGRSMLKCGRNASKDALKAISGNAPGIVHLATHGFQNPPTGKYDSFNSLVESMQTSGLRMNDGPLTSEEISGLDLSRTGLVYLSSCRSARGTVNYDGVFGLQRAFKKAGAGSLVMSLWDVNDIAACDFAESFYTLLHSGKEPATAFSATIDKMKRRYRSPYYWAGYVLVD
ncbi:MAG: CHAT domain-containing protein [Candidatus Cryptobacteroides sp.]